MPKLIQEFTYNADVSVREAGPGPFGLRVLGTIHSGRVLSGDRIKGVCVGAGGDWLLLGADGFARVDVRLTIETPDGANIYVQYTGLLEVTPAVEQIMAGGGAPTDYGDQYFFTCPRLETGHAKYSWVNNSMFVGEGRIYPGEPHPGVEYRVYRIEHS
jgi:hypothetical protein